MKDKLLKSKLYSGMGWNALVPFEPGKQYMEFYSGSIVPCLRLCVRRSEQRKLDHFTTLRQVRSINA